MIYTYIQSNIFMQFLVIYVLTSVIHAGLLYKPLATRRLPDMGPSMLDFISRNVY
jgi:hypothetical protein